MKASKIKYIGLFETSLFQVYPHPISELLNFFHTFDAAYQKMDAK